VIRPDPRIPTRTRLGLLAALWLLAGCGSEPDLLAFGARELPGTAEADYLTARPFSAAPDASMLVFATRLPAREESDDLLAFDRSRLASFRILDLDTGSKLALPALPPERLRDLELHGLLHEAPCWHADSRTLLFRTRTRSYLRFGPLYADPAWSLARRAPAGLDPACGERSGPFIGTRVVGRFSIERPEGKALRIRHTDAPGVLFEVQPDGAATQVTVSDAKLSPSGDALAVVYSKGVGSFTGKAHAAVVSVREATSPARPLGSGVLILDWLDERRLVGYARPDGRRNHALFSWSLD
jgi:hypothetical protein